MKNHEKPRKTMKNHEKPWKTNLEPWKTMKTDLEPWQPNLEPWKTMKTDLEVEVEVDLRPLGKVLIFHDRQTAPIIYKSLYLHFADCDRDKEPGATFPGKRYWWQTWGGSYRWLAWIQDTENRANFGIVVYIFVIAIIILIILLLLLHRHEF